MKAITERGRERERRANERKGNRFGVANILK